MKELVRMLGLPACLVLTREYGGRAIRVPADPVPTHPIVVRLGEVAARALISEYGGSMLEVPTARTALVEQRNQLIRAEVAGGASIGSTAVRWALSRKTIRNIVQPATRPRVPVAPSTRS